MISFLYKENGWINATRIKEVYVKKNHPIFYEKVIKFLEDNNLKLDSFSQKLYHYDNNLKSIPICPICKENKVKYIDFKTGYSVTCSIYCAGASSKVKEKREKTVMQRHDVNHVWKIKEVKEKVEKTNLERFGVKNPSMSKQISEKIKKSHLSRSKEEVEKSVEKRKKTCRKVYGTDTAWMNEDVKKKIEKTNLERYGIKNPFCHGEIRDKFKQKIDDQYIDKIKKSGINVIKYNKSLFTIKCDKCNQTYEITSGLLYQRDIRWNINPCIHCNPLMKGTSGQEDKVSEFIEENYRGEVLRSQKLIGKKEIDIYLPELKLGIEYNGIPWHSELFKPNDYHINKTNECDKKGIRLIHIFWDEWSYNEDIVKSRLLSILKKTSNKIYARKCKIKHVSNTDTILFLNKNHIQGQINGSVRLGLYYEDKLVSIMVYGKQRRALGTASVKNGYELLRFCSLLNTNVIGGASRLFKKFINEYSPEIVVSYADYRWSIGKLYENLGFEFECITKPNYWYIINGIRKHRYNYRKDILVKQGYDSNMTEHEIMMGRDLWRIYDCGNLKYIYTNK